MLELLSIASDEDRTEHENMSPCCIYYEGHRTFPELHSDFPKHFVHERYKRTAGTGLLAREPVENARRCRYIQPECDPMLVADE